MTKGELRKARRSAVAAGIELTGELAIPGVVVVVAHRPRPQTRIRRPRERVASREEQYARYLDCGPQAWDDR